MRIAVIMIHFGSFTVTRTALTDLRSKLGRHELILINNTPSDIQELVDIVPRTILIDNRKNTGFAKAVNQGIKRAIDSENIDGVLLLNNDARIEFGSIDLLARTFINKPMSGLVSPVLHHHGKLYDWGGTYNKWTGMVRHQNFEQKPKTTLTVSHIAGAAMLIKKDVINKIGNFDERFFAYFEDLDYCLRAAKAGFTIHINPDVVVEHAVSAGSKVFTRTLMQWHSHILFLSKYMFTAVQPTAVIFDILFYPIVLAKIFIKK